MSLVGAATSAAPTYFDAVHVPDVGKVVDGGVSANSPALVAWMEAVKLRGSQSRITMLELSCSPVKTISAFGSGLFSWANKLVPAFMDAGMDKDRYVLSHLIGFGDYLHVMSRDLGQSSLDMDDASLSNLGRLHEAGSLAAIENYSTILAFVRNSTMKFPKLGRK
jgi:patatin-like phospholipase/acyl hydrolase